MSLITTNDGRIVLKKAQSMMAVPYVYDSTIGDYVLGSDVYDISAVIGDSITIEQSDGDTEAKYNEFKASPLIESVSGSKYNFTAQCLDLQNSVLQSLFGAMVGSNGSAAFNDDFVIVYVLIRIRFANADLPDVVLPKVQMNSKIFIQQLRTRASQGNISGTALSRKCAVIDNPNHATQFTSLDGTSTYTPYTPVLFVPKSKNPIVFHHSGTTYDAYSLVNFSNGSVSHNVNVNPNSGWIDQDSGGGEGGGGGDEPDD